VNGLFHLISAPPPPPVEEQWNSSGVRDKSGGILGGKSQKLGNSSRVNAFL